MPLHRYLLKEYGSWGVMTMSGVAGLSGLDRIWPEGLLAFIALSLSINSKQALTLWLRGRGDERKGPMVCFLGHALLAGSLFLFLFGRSLPLFLPYAILPVVYILLLRFAGEHALLTEIAGFSLLALSALITRFATSGVIDPRLYLAVAVFFVAGVFKVRVQFKRRGVYRALSIAYLAAAVVIYHFIKMPLILLVPLLDNLIFALTLYRASLQTTGWTEVGKGAVFLLLLKLLVQ